MSAPHLYLHIFDSEKVGVKTISTPAPDRVLFTFSFGPDTAITMSSALAIRVADLISKALVATEPTEISE